MVQRGPGRVRLCHHRGAGGPVLPDLGEGVVWESQEEKNASHEANFLKLDCSKVKAAFGWRPRWHIEEAVRKTVEWSRVWLAGGDIPAEMDREIRTYLEGEG